MATALITHPDRPAGEKLKTIVFQEAGKVARLPTTTSMSHQARLQRRLLEAAKEARSIFEFAEATFKIMPPASLKRHPRSWRPLAASWPASQNEITHAFQACAERLKLETTIYENIITARDSVENATRIYTLLTIGSQTVFIAHPC